MQTLVGDASVIGVVGPVQLGRRQGPRSRSATTRACSSAARPTRTTALTMPESGRSTTARTIPDRINYIRDAATDSSRARAGDVRLQRPRPEERLHRRRRTDVRRGRRRHVRGGVQGARRDGREARQRSPRRPTTTRSSRQAKTKNPDGVYYGGVATSGAGLLLKQMRQQGLNIPFTGPDGIANWPRRRRGLPDRDRRQGQRGWLLGHDGRARRLPGEGGVRRGVQGGLRKRRHVQLPGAYSGPAHACTPVILTSLAEFLKANPDADLAAIREGVRAGATDAANTFDTAIGPKSLRQERRQHRAVHLVLQGRHDPCRRQGRLGLRQSSSQSFGRRSSSL